MNNEGESGGVNLEDSSSESENEGHQGMGGDLVDSEERVSEEEIALDPEKRNGCKKDSGEEDKNEGSRKRIKDMSADSAG